MAIDAPVRDESSKLEHSTLVSVGKAVGDKAVDSGDAVLGVFDALYAQLKFYVKIVRSLPRALGHPKEILVLMSDISLGSGALVVGGGMFFVVVSISFFTGTEVGLEGFNGLQQIGAEAFTGVITSLANTREITPL
ncbi:MAG TPA: ABC transporter permease, partial [Acidimicrobiales bacterium]